MLNIRMLKRELVNRGAGTLLFLADFELIKNEIHLFAYTARERRHHAPVQIK